jgi:excisionase family DNA binding protein
MKEIFGVKHYDINETAEILGISSTSVLNYIKAGTMKAAKVGGRWLVKEEDIKLYLENASTNSTKRNVEE